MRKIKEISRASSISEDFCKPAFKRSKNVIALIWHTRNVLHKSGVLYHYQVVFSFTDLAGIS